LRKSGTLGAQAGARPKGTESAQVIEASDRKAVVWTKPDNLEYNEADPVAGLVGLRHRRFLAALCDGAALRIPSSTEKETLRWLFVCNDGKPIPSPGKKADCAKLPCP
jgi:hypothetical protein